MPTQAELDKESGRSSLRSETMVGSGGKLETRVFSSGSRINQGSTEWGGEAKGAIFDISTNTYTPELDNQQGIDEDTNKRGIDDYEQPPAQEAGGGGETIFPFQIVQIDDNTIAIRKGTVSTIVPTISAVAMDDDYTLNTIDVTGATTFWLDATVNASEVITAVAIVTANPGADTAIQTKQVLGSLTWDSGAIDAISSNLGGSQNVDSCGASHSWNRI